jgi:hypothetical protein
MLDGAKILTMKNVVVVIRNVVVEKVTTGNLVWSLIVLTTELLMTIDDHIFVVATNF